MCNVETPLKLRLKVIKFQWCIQKFVNLVWGETLPFLLSLFSWAWEGTGLYKLLYM